jgi:site-specific DNA-methyltransferase (adenine-specific)
VTCGRKIGSFDCCSVVQGNCFELIPRIPDGSVDAIITDPPYGTGWARGGGKLEGEFSAIHERPEWDRFSLDWIRPSLAKHWAVFAPMSKARELQEVIPSSTVLYWHKSNPRPLAPSREPIIVSPPPYDFDTWDFRDYNGDTPLHPCQKPVRLMMWLIAIAPEFGTILDPFCGSGTTLVASTMLGYHYLGFEREQEYYEIAKKRLEKCNYPPMFQQKPEQIPLA